MCAAARVQSEWVLSYMYARSIMNYVWSAFNWQFLFIGCIYIAREQLINLCVIIAQVAFF